MKTFISLTTRALLAIISAGFFLNHSAEASSLTVTAGQSVKIEVTADGTQPFTYQWRKNGATIAGATLATYTIAAATTTDSANYSAVVTNAVDFTISDDAVLTVNSGSGGTAPTITTQPASRTVTAGQAASFSVTASGSATLTYQWRKSGTAISGATSSTFAIAATTATDAATYSVVVTNSAGSVTSNAATLSVNPVATAPTITSQPVSLSVTAGQTASFSVTASGSSLSYQWYKYGGAISGATAATYTIAATTTADAANYSVFVANSAGSATSNSVTLLVNPSNIIAPTIINQPTSLTVTAGQAASFSVTASGSATLTYQWRKSGTAIVGATKSTYSIPATTATDAALYSVVVTNSAGSVTSNSAVLTVNIDLGLVELTPQSFSARGQNAPAEGTAQLFDGQITTKWLDFSATSWVQITLAAPASLQAYGLTSANDMPERDPVSWTLSGSNNGTNWTVIETRSAQTWSNRYLVRDFILAAPSAAYTQFRFDFVSTSLSSVQLAELELFGLTGASLPDVPVITNQPKSFAVTAGQPASFSVTATSTVSLTYQWLKNGTAVAGATAATYTIAATTAADAANYSVIVSNFAKSVTSASAVLTVNPLLTAPAIIAQPASLTLTAGQSASFSVTASGSATLAYQWMKNGAVILGAINSSYTIATTTTADNASYSVFVANSAGSVTSNSATLTVNAVPSVLDLTPQSYSARSQLNTTVAIANLFDGQPATKWVDARAASWIKIVFASPTVLEAYSLTSANDAPDCDPASWTLSGSNDGTNWTVIETRAAQTWSNRQLVRDFILAAPSGAFTQFRFNLTASSGSIIQLADLDLFGRSVVSVKMTPATYSARGQASTSQGIAKLFDNRNSTKWVDFSGTSWIKIVLPSPALLRRYTLTSAADTPSYDPASWTLSGSNDDINWTVIDTRTSPSWSNRRQTRDFVLPAPANVFLRYRFDFQGNSSSVIQLAELKLYGDTGGSGAP